MTSLRERLRPRAMHEAGHAIAALCFGQPAQFERATVSEWKGRVEGGNLQELWNQYPRAWMVFGAAGLAAERIWLAQNLLQAQEREAFEDSEMDNANLIYLAKQTGVPVARARGAAHTLVAANWPQVVRLGMALEMRRRMQYAAARRQAGTVTRKAPVG